MNWNILFETRELTQQEIYSPTPTIKIKKWYQTTCLACVHLGTDWAEYCESWSICHENEKLANLKCFPKCSANSCKKFEQKCLSDTDGWCYIEDFEEAFGKEDCFKKLREYTDFKKRMGDYSVGRLA